MYIAMCDMFSRKKKTQNITSSCGDSFAGAREWKAEEKHNRRN